jgi:hypothetical protein
MYFDDLELCRYHAGPFDSDSWAVPLRAIGWLEYPHDFQKGVPPEELASKLAFLAVLMRQTFPQYTFRGVKTCSHCEAHGLKSPGPIWSQENLLIPGSGEVYLAPGGIVHYVEAHSYLPPASFVHAVLRCPDCDSPDYLFALQEANAGQATPIEEFKPFMPKK